MISKKIIFSQMYNMSDYSKQQILSLYNPYSENIKEVLHAVDSTENKGKFCLVKRRIQETKDLIIESIQSDDSEILGTNLYISCSLISSACPKLSKTIYIDSKLFLYVYPNTEEVKQALAEIERLTLYTMGTMRHFQPSDWKNYVKVYIETNIRFITPENQGKTVMEGEKYAYMGREDLFCNPDEFDEDNE